MEYYLTSERLEELKRELEELRNTRRIEVADRLKRAKELGDLSENSEYFEAREEYNQIEGRILELETMIKNASVIKKSESVVQIQIGSTIEVVKGKDSTKFTIVGSNEANPAEGRISNESLVGQKLLGAKLHDKVEIETPAGKADYEVVGIS